MLACPQLLLFCLAWWLVALPAVSSRGFLPVDLSHAFPDGVPPPPGYAAGLSWADVDQDSRPDLFLFSAESVRLYRNQGNWSFSEMTTTALPGDTLPAFYFGQSKWADFDQDGFPDLLAFGRVHFPPYPVRLLRNNQGRNFTDVTSQSLPALAGCVETTCAMEWGDFDGDNRVDLFVAQARAKTVFLNNGGQPTTFTEVDVSATVGGEASFSGEVRAGDFDGDGKDDLVWVMNGFSGVYRSNGDGTFTDETGGVLVDGGTPLPPLDQSSADWGDVNGDQRLDLVVCGLVKSGAPFSAVFVQTEEERKFRDGIAELFPEECCHKFASVQFALWISMVIPFSTWPSPV